MTGKTPPVLVAEGQDRGCRNQTQVAQGQALVRVFEWMCVVLAGQFGHCMQCLGNLKHGHAFLHALRQYQNKKMNIDKQPHSKVENKSLSIVTLTYFAQQ